MAGIEFCTVDQVKTALGILDNSQDAVISQLIPAVTYELMLAMNRLDFAPNLNYVDWLTSYGGCRLYLKHYPISEVDEVKINDQVIPEWDETDPTTMGWHLPIEDRNPDNLQYLEIFGAASCCYCGCYYYDLYPYPSYPYLCWPNSCTPNVKVTYHAGYGTVPPALQQAAIEMVAFKRAMGVILGADPNLTGRTMGDYQESFGGSRALADANNMGLPGSVASVIEQFRRWVV